MTARTEIALPPELCAEAPASRATGPVAAPPVPPAPTAEGPERVGGTPVFGAPTVVVPGAPTAEALLAPPTPGQIVTMAARFSLVVAAAAPTTTLVPMALTALFYRRFRDEERYHRWHRMSGWAWFCTRFAMQADVRVEGLDRLPRARQGVLCVSNHQSYVDIPVIMGALPFRAFLSKDLVAYIPFIGQIAWLGGTIYFNRRHPESRQRALEDTLRMCAQSTPVVVFPEGTRSQDGQLREVVRPGAMRAAWERGLRLCCFALDGTRNVFPPTMDRMYPHQRVAIVVGETLSPSRYPDGDAFAAAAWAEVGRCFARARVLRTSPHWAQLPTP